MAMAELLHTTRIHVYNVRAHAPPPRPLGGGGGARRQHSHAPYLLLVHVLREERESGKLLVFSQVNLA